jgi:multidrug efflux pump
VLLIGIVGLMFVRLPNSFLPNEDQGYIIANIQLPPGATAARTDVVLKAMEAYVLKQPEVADMVAVTGFSFTGQGQNMGLAFIPLKSWDERKGQGQGAQDLANRITMHMGALRDSFIFVVSPPPIPELGRGTGFSFRLQDRGGMGHAALLQARNQMLGMAMQSKILTGIRPEGLEDAPQLKLNIDRDKAQALGVTFASINTALSTSLGSAYVNDFPNAGRLQRVIVQADAPERMQPEDLLRINALNSKGQPVPMSAFASTAWVTGPMQTTRYNGYSAMSITGDAAPGYSTGQALDEMQALAARLPPGFAYEWTGQSREELLAGSTVFVLIGFALLAVFLALAALYESWTIPVAVLLVVPLGVLGSLCAASLRGLANDVYFKVGLITIIGLAAKNAILIVEFAKDLQAQGRSPLEAALEAAHLRFRPIIMTSLAFILGVLPLVVASGAGAASQRAIGTGVMGGMITATLLGVFFVPVFFVVIRSFFKGSKRQQALYAHAEEEKSVESKI